MSLSLLTRKIVSTQKSSLDLGSYFLINLALVSEILFIAQRTQISLMLDYIAFSPLKVCYESVFVFF